MFTLAICCLTTSNLPWFTDLTFQVPMQYCCLQHQTLFPSPVTSTAGCCFCFGSISSVFLELFLHWSPVAYWAPTDLGKSAAAAKLLQSCPILCDPIDSSPPGSPFPGILQARTLEWVAISFSNAWKWKVKVKSLSHVRPHGLQPTRLLRPWDFPGKSTGVGCHCLLWDHQSSPYLF